VKEVREVNQRNENSRGHAPVTVLASSETRYDTKPATSSEVVSRPIGVTVDAKAAAACSCGERSSSMEKD